MWTSGWVTIASTASSALLRRDIHVDSQPTYFAEIAALNLCAPLPDMQKTRIGQHRWRHFSRVDPGNAKPSGEQGLA